MTDTPMEDRHPMTGNRMSDEESRGSHGIEHHKYDVIVIGAGGAGLRAAIAAHDAGARTVSQLRISATTTAAYQNQRWMLLRISGSRVSPE
jgi:succinate dehydrogenase/fumarate reductase flavoprotein subunit